jgi:hypothetical protein
MIVVVLKGPSWLPVVGNLPDLKRKCREKKYLHEAIAALAREHNTHVLGLRMGTDLTIVVFGHELVKEVFTREEFDGRPDSFFIRLRGMGGRRGENTQLGCIMASVFLTQLNDTSCRILREQLTEVVSTTNLLGERTVWKHDMEIG